VLLEQLDFAEGDSIGHARLSAHWHFSCIDAELAEVALVGLSGSAVKLDYDVGAGLDAGAAAAQTALPFLGGPYSRVALLDLGKRGQAFVRLALLYCSFCTSSTATQSLTRPAARSSPFR
jgi:hypothetical protein